MEGSISITFDSSQRIRRSPSRSTSISDAPSGTNAVAILYSTVSGQDSLKERMGIVRFASAGPDLVEASYDVSGLAPGYHGMHVHELGDNTNGCISAGEHYNPSGRDHGGRTGPDRHEGDMGNIAADRSGVARGTLSFEANLARLIGRTVVVHANEDDLGRGRDLRSLKDGNSGERVCCGVIGRSL